MTIEKIVYVLEQAPDIEPPAEDISQEVRAKYDKHKQHAANIISYLQELYGEGTRNRRFSTVCELLKTMMVKGAPVHKHGLKMIGLIEHLESLSSPLDQNLATIIFFESISDSFSQFVMNYNMGKMEHTFSMLLNMCVTLKKPSREKEEMGPLLFLRRGGIKKKQEERKEANGQCFHYRKDEHWKMNCRSYLARMKDNRAEGTA
ncbi:hypothetical protein PRUPE_2G062600 [Prunus persica]|uniref:Uncharacterized protein n=1 Tax=Prunus persica TaxID=3760 RepID=M5X3I5_PRUPE|nr:hypothetical protein PRUPE_2G062600 [Prunus persica]